MLVSIVTSILFILSFLMILVGFLMAPETNSFSGAIVGSSDLKLFSQTKEQGWKKIIKWAMIILGFLLLIATLLIRIFL